MPLHPWVGHHLTAHNGYGPTAQDPITTGREERPVGILGPRDHSSKHPISLPPTAGRGHCTSAQPGHSIITIVAASAPRSSGAFRRQARDCQIPRWPRSRGSGLDRRVEVFVESLLMARSRGIGSAALLNLAPGQAFGGSDRGAMLNISSTQHAGPEITLLLVRT